MTEGKPQASIEQVEQAWMRACRDELMTIDPRYVIVFNIRWRQFGGDCTAAQLFRALQARKWRWSPTTERAVQRWLTEILPVEELHRRAAPSGQPTATN